MFRVCARPFPLLSSRAVVVFSDVFSPISPPPLPPLQKQLIAASTDTPEVHLAWIKTPRKRGGLGYMQIPIMADVTKVRAGARPAGRPALIHGRPGRPCQDSICTPGRGAMR